MLSDLDAKKFYDEYRRAVAGGTLAQLEIDNLNEIISRALIDARVPSIRHLASIIATARWETRRFERLREVGSDDYLRQYQNKGGNIHAGDFKRFRGGGWPHVTFRANYAKLGRLLLAAGLERAELETYPERILEPEINYEATVRGFLEGLFTKWKLGDFINVSATDYRRARLVINPGEYLIAEGHITATAARRSQCVIALDTITRWSRATEAALRLSTQEKGVKAMTVNLDAFLDDNEYQTKPEPGEYDRHAGMRPGSIIGE